MATFPNLKRFPIDDRQPDNGLIVVNAPDGHQFGQSLYGEVWYTFQPTFVDLTESEANNLVAFEAANRSLAFDFEYKHWNRSTIIYECRFLNPGVKIIWLSAQIQAMAFFRGRVKP